MEVKVLKNKEEIGKFVSNIIEEKLKEKNLNNEYFKLGLATGSTPIPIYQELVKRYNENKIDFSKTITFNLDEYVGLEETNDQSYHYFMNDNLFNYINVKKENINIPLANLDNDDEIKKFALEYEEKIKKAGGIDIQILGIGENGHIGFNEPDNMLIINTGKVNLTEDTIKVNSRFFEKIDDVPKSAVTMGMKTILDADKIIIIATGEKKKEVVKFLLEKKGITTSVPASFLFLHKDCILVLDEDVKNACN